MSLLRALVLWCPTVGERIDVTAQMKRIIERTFLQLVTAKMNVHLQDRTNELLTTTVPQLASRKASQSPSGDSFLPARHQFRHLHLTFDELCTLFFFRGFSRS